jgi:hypothetical protein
LEGTAVVRFKNSTSKPMDRLAFVWPSADGRSLQITSKGGAVSMLADSIESQYANQSVQTLLVQLPVPIRPAQEAKLELTFAGVKPAHAAGDSMGYLRWCPRIWWGFETRDDFDVKIAVPKGYKAIVSGVLDVESGYHRAEGVRLLGLILSKDLEIIEKYAGDVIVRCLFKPKGEKCAKLLLETAVDVINFYRERFGFYPYSHLAIVPGMDRPAGGYPVATGIVAIHGMERMADKPQLHWKWITAHEIGHQYWGEYVLEKDSPRWLWIGLGIYADREYTQSRGLGPEEHQRLMARYIDGVRKGLDTTINRSQEQLCQIKFDFNNVVIHGKGYSVISALDCILGPAVFDRIYRRCLKEFGGRRLGVSEFRAVCEQEAGQDLGWFFEQWVDSNRILSYEIASKRCEKKGDRYFSEVEIKCLGDLKMPVPVAAYFEDGTSHVKLTGRLLDTNVLRFESASELKRVQLDPDGRLALVVPLPAPDEAQLMEMLRELPWTEGGRRALDVFEKAKEGKMTNADGWFKLALTLYDGKYYSQATEAFRHTHDLAEETSYKYLASLVWQGHILDLLGQRDEALKRYREVLEKDQGTHGHVWVRHDQYGIRIGRKWVEERIEKPFLRE